MSERRTPSASERRAKRKNQPASANPFMTVTASSRRAARRTTTRSSGETNNVADAKALKQDKVAELLANPTKQVSEDELRQTYSYVISDLRGMAILAAGLVVFLVVLAQVLPR